MSKKIKLSTITHPVKKTLKSLLTKLKNFPTYTKNHYNSITFIFWTIYILLQILWITDRFTTNVWPRQSFSKFKWENGTKVKVYGTGTDRDELKDGPTSVKIYDVIVRISARYSIFALNALFLTMCHTTWIFLSENRTLKKYIDFSDETARLVIHEKIALSLCVLMILHVWAIFLPCIFDNWTAVVKAGHFTPILSEKTPEGFKDANPELKEMNLQVDDVWRIVLMSIIMGPLMWISVKKIKENYRWGIRIHIFIAIMYFIDIWRRHSHPHSWVINTPMFLYWLLDKYLGTYYGVQKVTFNAFYISKTYMCYYWSSSRKIANNDVETIGRIYNVRNASEYRVRRERKHPFTCFSKRDDFSDSMKGFMASPDNENSVVIKNARNQLCLNSGSKNSKPSFNRNATISLQAHQEKGSAEKRLNKTRQQNLSLPSTKKEEDNYIRDSNWTTGFICKIYTSNDSFTSSIDVNLLQQKFNVWPLYSAESVYRALIMKDQAQTSNIFIAGGSGIGYLVDILSYLMSKKNSINVAEKRPKPKIKIIFTSFDFQLVQWFVNGCNSLNLTKILEQNLQIFIALTKGKNSQHGIKEIEFFKKSLKFKWGEVLLGRMDFKEIFRNFKNGEDRDGIKYSVYFHGGKALKEVIGDACEKEGFDYYAGYSFG